MRGSAALWATVLAALAAGTAWGKDPIQVCEAGGACSGLSQNGLIDFAKSYESNPRDLSLFILDHPFTFDVTPDSCGAACTELRFVSRELGIDRRFTGANTAAVSSAFQDFIKSEVLNRFDLTGSVSKMFGLRDKKFIDFGLGTAWFF